MELRASSHNLDRMVLEEPQELEDKELEASEDLVEPLVLMEELEEQLVLMEVQVALLEHMEDLELLQQHMEDLVVHQEVMELQEPLEVHTEALEAMVVLVLLEEFTSVQEVKVVQVL